jgi:hypothetical protein
MKVYKMGPMGFNKCIEKDYKAILCWLEEAEVGDGFTIEVLEMTEKEYNALPEYWGP